eukprot:27117-Eustigmatos_ZCMA.PRE.1
MKEIVGTPTPDGLHRIPTKTPESAPPLLRGVATAVYPSVLLNTLDQDIPLLEVHLARALQCGNKRETILMCVRDMKDDHRWDRIR